ncbi:MAG: hypothetical protein ACFFD8_06245 [Candidatus Thorarchaeota archaeon]
MDTNQQSQWRQRLDRILTIDRDWVFFSLAFIPFFVLSFAVWICLDEAIFALRYHVVIQWSLFPYFRVFADMWHYIGIVFFVIGLILMGFTLMMHRGSTPTPSTASDPIQWFRIIHRLQIWIRESRILVLVALIGLSSLVCGLAVMRYAFISQMSCSFSGPGIPCFTSLFGLITIESLFLHQLGDVFVAIGLVLLFMVIIRERTED